MRDDSSLPLIVDLRRNSLDDGPGIRTVVFFKGCPLRCVWCQNPETHSPLSQIQRFPSRCQRCNACRTVCARGIPRPGDEPEDHQECQVCGKCAAICPAAARRIAGIEYSVDELVRTLSKDEPFYRRSHGGVTFSGGEPALYPAFAGQTAKQLRAHGIHMLIETAGAFDWPSFSDCLLPHVDTVYFDIKLADPVLHRSFVGQGNERILGNFEKLVESGFKDILPRVPLIPGITTSEENLAGIANLLSRLGQKKVALLPYNPLGLHKRQALTMPIAYDRDRWMSPDEIQACETMLRSRGLELVG